VPQFVIGTSTRNPVRGPAAFGSITSAGNPRVFEFAGRVNF